MMIDEGLSDGAVRLRPFAPEDAPTVFAAVEESRAEVAPWMPDLSAVRSAAEVAGWIAAAAQTRAEGSAYHFAMVDAGDGSLIGGCGLTQISRQHRFANLYYWVRTGRAGRGAATAATRLLAGFGLARLDLYRIELVMDVANGASKRVAEKAGAHYEGRLRNRLRAHGTSRDAFMFSLIPGDLDYGPGAAQPAGAAMTER